MRSILLLTCLLTAVAGFAQNPTASLATLPQAKDYVLRRASSYDRSGGNADFREIPAGGTLTLLDENGPGEVTHFWCTIATRDPNHLKAIVLRMFWDGEATPSVEAPIGDFFGQGLGDYHQFESAPLAVGSIKALNSFFPMPFPRHARISVTNESSIPTGSFYFNIDWRSSAKPLRRRSTPYMDSRNSPSICASWDTMPTISAHNTLTSFPCLARVGPFCPT